jgi:glycine cleavage system H protein
MARTLLGLVAVGVLAAVLAPQVASAQFFSSLGQPAQINCNSNYKYSADHAAVRFDANIATVSISPGITTSLLDLTSVWLTVEPGARVTAGQEVGMATFVAADFPLIAPVSGIIGSLNAGVDAAPFTAKSDPYGAGWVYKVTLTTNEDASTISTLLNLEEYTELDGVTCS